MVGPRKPRTHKIWYTGARLTQRSLGPIKPLAKVVGGLGRDRCSRAAAPRGEENYPPCKALKNHEMEK
jgi:hypothetical protein